MRPLTAYDERAFARWIRGHAMKEAAERRDRQGSAAARKRRGGTRHDKEDSR